MHGISKDELQSEDLRQYRRRMRVAWAAGATVVLLAVAAVIGAIAALDARSQANGLADTAQIERVAAESGALRSTQPDLARLLAVEAFRRADDPATRAALQQAGTAPLTPARVIGPANPSDTSQLFSRVAFSTDGRIAATLRGLSGTPETLELFDDTSGRSVMRVNVSSVQPGATSAVALDARGRRVAYYDGRTVSVFDVATKRKIVDIQAAATSPTIALALDADGGRVAISRPLIQVFDVGTGQPNGPAIRASEDPSALALAADGTRVAAVVGFAPSGAGAVLGDELPRALTGAASDGVQAAVSTATAGVWDVGSGAPVPLAALPAQVRTVAFAPAGDRLAVGTDGSGVRVYDVASGRHRTVPGVVGAFASDGTILTVTADGTVTRFDAGTGHAKGVPSLLPSPGLFTFAGQVAWLAPGRVVTGGSGIKVWNVAAADHLSATPMGVAGAQVYALSSDGRQALVEDHPSDTMLPGDALSITNNSNPAAVGNVPADSVALIATESGRVVADGVGTGVGSPLGGTFAAANTRFAVGSFGGLRLSKVPKFSAVKTLPIGPTQYIGALASSRNGRIVAYAVTTSAPPGPDGLPSGSSDSALRFVDARSGRTLGSPVDLHSSLVLRVVFSADGRHVLALGDGAPALVDVRTHHLERLSALASQSSGGAAYSPDGRLLTLSESSGVVFLDASTLQQVGASWEEPGTNPTFVTFSPDSSELAVGVSENGLQTARLVDVATRSTIGVYPGGMYGPLAFLGRTTLVAPGPGGVFRWSLDPQRWVAAACAAAGHNLSRADWGRYLPSGSTYRATCPEFPSGR
jgi:WD40 repeat protein